MSLSESTKARFAKEVAKYPADQKQSAVMACLAIVQQEQGWVSAEAEAGIAEYLGMPAIAVREVTTFYNMYNQQPVGKYAERLHQPAVPAARRPKRWNICANRWVSKTAALGDGLFTVKCECSAPAPTHQ
jgi:NADH-quinone oxidoreductase subunit E